MINPLINTSNPCWISQNIIKLSIKVSFQKTIFKSQISKQIFFKFNLKREIKIYLTWQFHSFSNPFPFPVSSQTSYYIKWMEMKFSY